MLSQDTINHFYGNLMLGVTFIFAVVMLKDIVEDCLKELDKIITNYINGRDL